MILLSACSRTRILKNLTIEQKMAYGDNYFEKKKYNLAKEFYSDIIYDRKTNYTAKAQIKLADCYFNMNKFDDARFEYEEYVRMFPDLPDVNRAFFQIGVCYYENSLPAHYTQSDTKSAIDAFNQFIDKFPNDKLISKAKEYLKKCHHKLIEKKYWNGYAYYKVYDYSAAMMYFKEVLRENLTDDIDKMTLYYSAKIYFKRNDKDNLQLYLAKLEEKYPDSKETRKIKKLFAKLK